MDPDDTHIAGEFFLHPTNVEPTRTKRFFECFEKFLPRETMVYIQHCLLRIPFVLIYDYLFTEQFSSLINSSFNYSVELFDRQNRFLFRPISFLLHTYAVQILLQVNLFLSIPVVGTIVLVFFLLCSDRHLVNFYSYFISMLVIYFDYKMTAFVDNSSSHSLNMYILQFILSSVYIQMLNLRPKTPSHRYQTYLCHFAPFALIISHHFVPSSMNMTILRSYYLLWTSAHLSEVFLHHFQNLIDLIRDRFIHELYPIHQNFGFQTLLDYVETNANVLALLKVFWLTKILILPLGIRTVYNNPFLSNGTNLENQINFSLGENAELNDDPSTIYNQTMWKTIYFTGLFYGTETILTLISLACLVSHVMKTISHRLFRFLQLWNEDAEQIGTLVGVMFFLLLFQSNITRIDLDRRHVPLLKAFSLLIVALFHFLHTILEPQLLKVAMQTMTTKMAFEESNEQQNSEESSTDQKNTSNGLSMIYSFHHQHVYTCIGILFFLGFYMFLLWRLTSFSTWLLAVSAFSLELIVRLLASLGQFTVYVLDAHGRLKNGDLPDEYVFRIKAVNSCFEFILGVFLLFNGIYIFLYESRGALRALMLGIHAYTNILKNLRSGWKIFNNRKSAWTEVNRLPLATEHQILTNNDICSICHLELKVGVTCVTPCSHLFHQKCLQKAFYTKRNCALCSSSIVFQTKQHDD